MIKTKSFITLSLLLMFTFISVAIGAATRPAATAPLPIVNVLKLDNSTVHGRFIGADPDSVTIQPLTPANAPEINVPWKDIKVVSNGMTHAMAIETWKALHKDQLCDTCHGDRTVFCATCKGTGKDLTTRADCTACHGVGLITCTAPKCDQGQIPCHGPCLKLSVGVWVAKPDGLKWRTFPTAVKGQTFVISTHHLGQVVELVNGLATGNIIECPVCHGKQTANCTLCAGVGKIPCTVCIKSPAPACPDHCDAGRIPCPDCAATGLKK